MTRTTIENKTKGKLGKGEPLFTSKEEVAYARERLREAIEPQMRRYAEARREAYHWSKTKMLD